jgi:hypothetical protein
MVGMGGRGSWGVASTFLLGLLLPGLARAAVNCSSTKAVGAYTCSIDPTFDPTALCNDGTLPAFWWRPGYGSGISTWVIWLQGGVGCVNQVSCAQRAADPVTAPLITSNGFTATLEEAQGVLSPAPGQNPALYSANEVMLHYCSSDSWSGNQAGVGSFDPNNPATWSFKGRPIALAAVQSIAELAPGFATASRVILGGSSAGGQGATITANDLLPLLPAGAQVLLVNDAGFTLDIGQYDSAIPAPYVYPGHPNAFETAAKSGLALWNGRGDAICDAAAQTPQQRMLCFFSDYVLQNGYIALPTFVAESQLDTGQMPNDLCPQNYGMCNVPHNPLSTKGQYATQWGVQMQADVIGANTEAAYTAFTPNEYLHIMLQDTALFQTQFKVQEGRQSPQDALDAWLADPTAPRIVTIGTGPGVD